MHFVALTWQTLRTLQRGRLFIPILIAQVAIVAFAYFAGEWGIDSSAKIFADVLLFGVHIMGHSLGIFWSVQAVAEGRLDGSAQFELAAPVRREVWVLSRYFGVAIGLIGLAGSTVLLWAAFAFVDFRESWSPIIGVVSLQALSWLVLAGFTVFLATFSGAYTALFVSFCAWFTGLLAQIVAENFPPDFPPLLGRAVDILAHLWNLQRFNLVPYEALSLTTWLHTVLYGVGLILGSLALSCIVFSRRDVVL